MTAFIMTETMRGENIEFTIDWGARSIKNFILDLLKGSAHASAKGTISIKGQTDKIKCSGCLELRYGQGKIYYTLYYTAGRNHTYHQLLGSKSNIKLSTLPKSHLECECSIYKGYDDLPFIKDTVKFSLLDLPKFLASFKLLSTEEFNKRMR